MPGASSRRIRLDLSDQSVGGSEGAVDYVLLSDSGRPSYGTPRWDFESGLDGRTRYNISAQTVAGGVFSFTSSANPIAITQNPLGLADDDFRFIRLELENSAPGPWANVYFMATTDPSASESKRIGVLSATSGFETYYIPAADRARKGALHDLRIDLPASQGSPATSSIESIVLIAEQVPAPRQVAGTRRVQRQGVGIASNRDSSS